MKAYVDACLRRMNQIVAVFAFARFLFAVAVGADAAENPDIAFILAETG